MFWNYSIPIPPKWRRQCSQPLEHEPRSSDRRESGFLCSVYQSLMCRLISWAALAVVVSQRTVESWPPQLLSCKESACNAGDAGNTGLIPGLGRSPGGEHGNLLQYSCLRSLESYSPEGCKESDTTERLGTATAHLGRKSVITCLSNCSFIYSRPCTLYLSWEQMETDKIQELFFSETFFFFFLT